MDLNNPVKRQERYIKKHYPDEYQTIIKYPGRTWSEKLYMYEHEINKLPKCPVCGKYVKYHATYGYNTYCSQSCVRKSELVQEKTKQTCLEKYGVTHYTNREKYKQTCLEKYGVDNVNELSSIREKISRTNYERYGGTGFASRKLAEKTYKTCKTRHGVSNIQQKHLTKTYPEIQSVNGQVWVCKCPHSDCSKCEEKTYETNQRTHYTRSNANMELCTKLNPITHKQIKSTYIEIFIRRILDEYNITYETNSYKIIPPKELDIYIPSMKMGIECNGVYHHSSKRVPSSHHKHKYELCKQQGIKLISIWEDQIHTKPNIVESLILSKLSIYKYKFNARQCSIRLIDAKMTNQFLNENHIQGKTTSNIKLGLFYNDELVSVMTFSKSKGCQGSKQHIDGQWELNRFCSKLNTCVRGAASKLLKFFIKTYNPKSIVSFSHNDISDGNLYKKLGFVEIQGINNSYYYVDKQMKRWHRSTFTKAAIVSRGWKDKVDNTWTESEIMDEHGFLKIHDCGTQKWILKGTFLNKHNKSDNRLLKHRIDK